jgi:phosphoenolpyruvate carboxykinase (ATP)
MPATHGSISGDLSQHGLAPQGEVHWNLNAAHLIELAVERGEGVFSTHRALVTETGERTGRSPNDKFIVEESSTTEDINWGDVNVSTDWPPLPHFERRSSPTSKHATPCSFRTCIAAQNPVKPSPSVSSPTTLGTAPLPGRTCLSAQTKTNWPIMSLSSPCFHAPHFEAVPEVDGVNSHVFVIVNYAAKEVIIGEAATLAKSKSHLLCDEPHPAEERLLPMHCSANTTGENTAIFFGLSGTGKTTLSADPKRALIGDDEHGWGANGVFNFEGGCYAKLIDLSEEDEPAIFGTTRRFGTVLENIVLDDDGVPDFADTSKTQNTRGSYPIEFIDNRTPDSKGGHPQNVIS